MIFKARYADNPPGDRFLVLAAYGTSKLKLGQRPFDFTIANAQALNMLRLPQATRFDLDDVVWLPWAKPFFVPRRVDRFAVPTISVLPEPLQETLRWTMQEREQRDMNAAFRPSPEDLDGE